MPSLLLDLKVMIRVLRDVGLRISRWVLFSMALYDNIAR